MSGEGSNPSTHEIQKRCRMVERRSGKYEGDGQHRAKKTGLPEKRGAEERPVAASCEP